MSSMRVSCTGIEKTYERAVYPSVLLQDHLLHWNRHRQKWRVEALKNINLSVGDGEWLGIFGPNGSGKTTLLQIIAGLLPPDNGSVCVEGKLSAFLGLGAGFHMERSAVENVYLHGLLHGLSPRAIRKQIDGVIEFAGIETHRDVPMKCFSTGMTMRLAYAATAFIDSDTYLFDEVLAVGDGDFQAKCRGHMRQLKGKGKTVILVSHCLDELRALCDRVLFIEHGSIVREEVAQQKNGQPSTEKAATYARG